MEKDFLTMGESRMPACCWNPMVERRRRRILENGGGQLQKPRT